MMEFARQAARHMPECEVIELHHDQKLDALAGHRREAHGHPAIREAGGNVHDPIHSVRLLAWWRTRRCSSAASARRSIRHDSIARESFMPGVLLAVRRPACSTARP